MKIYLFDLAPECLSQESKLNEVLAQFSSLVSFWSEIPAAERTSKSASTASLFAEVLASVVDIFKCSVKNDRDRPPSVVIRAARRVILENLKGEGPVSELCKAVMAYATPKTAMEVAKDRSASGLSDEAANTSFSAALGRFEDFFAPAMDDLGCWVMGGAAGGQQSISTLRPAFTEIQTMLDQTFAALDRWSSFALQGRSEDISIVLSNIAQLVQVGLLVMFLDFGSVMFAGGTLPTPPAEAATATTTSAKPIERGARGAPADLAQVAASKPSAAAAAEVSKAVGMKGECQAFAALLGDVSSSMARVSDTMSTKAGACGFEMPSPSPAECTADIDHAWKMLANINDYIRLCCIVGAVEVDYEKAPYLRFNESDREYTDSLFAFARLHTQVSAPAAVQLKCHCLVPPEAATTVIVEGMSAFVKDRGIDTYAKHASTFVKSCMQAVLEARVVVFVANEAIIKENCLDGLLWHILSDDGWQQRLPSRVDFKEDFELGCMTQDWKHNRAFRSLETFIGATSLPEMSMENISHPDLQKNMVPSKVARAALRSICFVRDLVVIGAVLQTSFLSEVAAGKEICEDDIFSEFTRALAEFTQTIVKFDNFLEDGHTFELERDGWRFDPSFAVLRQWRRCASAFGGRCLNTLLTKFVDILEGKCNACKNAAPDWRAAFDQQGKFNLELAVKLVKNRLKPLVDAHNSIHAIMRRMSSSASLLEVSPRLQDHPITAQSIAVALNGLAAATVASTVCSGVEVLVAGQLDPAGPQRAKDFVQKNKQGAAAEQIPTSFWDELQHLAQNALVKQSPSKLRSDMSSPSAAGKKESASSGDGTARSHCGASSSSAQPVSGPEVKTQVKREARGPADAPQGAPAAQPALKRARRQ